MTDPMEVRGNPGGPRSRTHSGTSRPRGGPGPMPQRQPGAGFRPPPPGGGQDSGGTGEGCRMALPVAVLATLFYAMPRMAWANWKERRRG